MSERRRCPDCGSGELCYSDCPRMRKPESSAPADTPALTEENYAAIRDCASLMVSGHIPATVQEMELALALLASESRVRDLEATALTADEAKHILSQPCLYGSEAVVKLANIAGLLRRTDARPWGGSPGNGAVSTKGEDE